MCVCVCVCVCDICVSACLCVYVCWSTTVSFSTRTLLQPHPTSPNSRTFPTTRRVRNIANCSRSPHCWNTPGCRTGRVRTRRQRRCSVHVPTHRLVRERHTKRFSHQPGLRDTLGCEGGGTQCPFLPNFSISVSFADNFHISQTFPELYQHDNFPTLPLLKKGLLSFPGFADRAACDFQQGHNA